MPGRIEVDLVDAVAEAIVAAQLRGAQVGAAPELEGLGAAEQRAEGRDARERPVCAFPDEDGRCPWEERIAALEELIAQNEAGE